MYRPRDKATPPAKLTKISSAEHDILKQNGQTDHEFWNVNTGNHVALIKDFRKEIKSHYWHIQGRRCCYCSKELDAHQGSFDAEHILPKVNFPQFMFEFINLAIGCKTCNSRKSDKDIHKGVTNLTEVPLDTAYYSIIHPHFDEWTDHLCFDIYGRVAPKNDDAKGTATIKICGIAFLNAARLADYFDPRQRKEVQKALEILCGEDNSVKKLKKLKLLRLLVDDHGLEKAAPILDLLEAEYKDSGGKFI
ncbi:hypothetical protein ALP39_200519 [Pseudomonas marginalis pv. marginalis]|nr:hypothetical protein ALP39_200519 [Pseudomonas marginalis pv. marginalis]